jgi:hypothetical protein
METNTLRVHLKIWVYDAGPPPAEPLPVSLCVTHRSLSEPLTDENALVSCVECQGIMRRLLLD